MESALNSLIDLTEILVEAEQKLEQAIGQVTSRLREVDVSEQEDMAQVDKTCYRLHKLVEDFRKTMKEKTRTSHLKIKNLLRDVKTDLSNRLGKVTSHKHIVTRAVAVSPRPTLIHMTEAVKDRVNSLDLSATLNADCWVKPLSSVESCQEVAGRVENELLMFEQQKTESKKELQPPVLVFHENCGTNIRLTNCNKTAEKITPRTSGNGMVLSRDVMVADVLYEVRVDAVLQRNSTLSLGVTKVPPAHLHMTRYSTDLEDAIIIGFGGVVHQKRLVFKTIGKILKDFMSGVKLGY
ncbi:uncharacterized protein LOC112574673 [Pomacea canaliculata]|uniref:uncharacterized protein LOC112574673 n=1 Tax=Pomacea canaliculata TaxID=400727 RepID=UPI000D73BC0B|nr:uncharacterized protein LOC112574673 [Pomacea canaliculata]XP_025111676.1 uncharacterized protein LOC112574673 [Pomacea canaliculata]XP_025111677.1 uncharacterized protein LOC112574673 [Pomacea canaliculata]